MSKGDVGISKQQRRDLLIGNSAGRSWTLACLLALLAGLPCATAGDAKYGISVRRDEQRIPSPPVAAASAYDSKRGAMLVFGGTGPGSNDAAPILCKLDLVTGRWSNVEVSGPVPTAKVLPSIVYDPKRDALFLFGGWATSADKPSGEFWMLPLGSDGPPAWKLLPARDPMPPARNGAAMVMDEKRDRLLLHGGDGGPHPKYGFAPLDDLWAYDLAGGTWSRLQPTGEVPPVRWNHAAAIAGEAKMFVFGGVGHIDGKVARDAHVFELDLDSLVWKKHATGGKGPTPMMGSSLTWDAGAGVLVIAGGLSVADTGEAGSTSVWVFDPRGSRWSEVTGVLPQTRRAHTAVYDPRRKEHVIVGGETAQERGNFYAKGKVLPDTIFLRLTTE